MNDESRKKQQQQFTQIDSDVYVSMYICLPLDAETKYEKSFATYSTTYISRTSHAEKCQVIRESPLKSFHLNEYRIPLTAGTNKK